MSVQITNAQYIRNALPQEAVAAMHDQNRAWGMLTGNAVDPQGEIIEAVINSGDSTLRRDDFVKVMTDVTQVRENSLTALAALRTSGLVTGASLSDTVIEVENVNDYEPAKVSMNAVAATVNQTTFASDFTALPMFTSGWKIRFRQGLAYKGQAGLRASARQVLVAQESAIYNGVPSLQVKFNGADANIYGYLNHPDRQVTTISDWNDIAANGDKIVGEVIDLVSLAFNNAAVEEASSMDLHVANNLYMALTNDYSAQKGDDDFLTRIKKIPQIREVIPSSVMPSNTVALVHMAPESLEYPEAQAVTTVPYMRTSPVSDQDFLTFAAGTLVIRTDRNGRNGIVTATVA